MHTHSRLASRHALILASVAALTLAVAACEDAAEPGSQTDADVELQDAPASSTPDTSESAPPDSAADGEDAPHPDVSDAPGPDATDPDVGDAPSPDTHTPDAGDAPSPDTHTPDAGDAPSPDTHTPDAGGGDAIVLPDEPPPIVGSLSSFIGEWTMEPGEERTRCVVKRLDNPDAVWVSRVRTELARGSHHMIVYRSQATEERTEPFDCQPFVETLQDNTFPLMITQIAEETLDFPNGVAFRFDAHQMVRIEAHFLNYFPEETITARGDVHFDTIAAEDVAAEANMLFYGNPDFEIPPNSTHTTPWGFIPVPEDTRVFAMTGHTHQYGTDVEIAYAADADDVDGAHLYPGDARFRWDEAPVVNYDPPVTFGAADGIRYRCSWDNTSDERVGFGESASSEMCFLWAYYYPSDGYKICVNTGSYKEMAEDFGVEVGDYVCCPGHFVCGLIAGFL